MGLALIVTAILMTLKQTGMINILGEGNVATGLTGVKLIIGIVGNFALGALMTMGVGLYAALYGYGLHVRAESASSLSYHVGFLCRMMPVASINFIKTNEYARKLSLGITIGGIIGVIIAAKFCDRARYYCSYVDRDCGHYLYRPYVSAKKLQDKSCAKCIDFKKGEYVCSRRLM